MVNAKQAISKLPLLLVNNKTTTKRGHNEYKRKERGVRRWKHRNPEDYSTLTNKYLSIVEKIDSSVEKSKNF